MSITLSQLASMSIGGVSVESDANAALVYMEVSYPDQLKLFFGFGNTSSQVFVSGSTLPRVIVTVDLSSGMWSSSNGLQGTLAPSGLTTLQTVVLNIRNGLENFGVNQGIVVGTAVPWTTGMFQ